jgi:hypothetical protein
MCPCALRQPPHLGKSRREEREWIGAIAQHIESYDARLVSTRNRVLLRSGKEGIKLIGHDRNVDMNK